MGDLINLKQVKKRIAREEATKQAETNRARFGRTKGERKRDETLAERNNRALDQHRVNDETPA